MASDKKAWFELLLNPSLIENHLNESTVSSSIELLIQFIFHGLKKNEVLTTEINQEVDPVMHQVHKKKHHILTVLPLQISAHHSWKLEIFEESLPLYIQDALLVSLLHETLEEMPNPQAHATLDIDLLKPHQLFTVALYHRFALRALVNKKLPSKPVKVSNVVIPGQQDPTQESREVREGVTFTLERMADNSVRILEQLLCAGEVRAPTIASFSMIPGNSNKGAEHFWDKCCLVADEQFKCQLHYDLGVYHFVMEKYTDAFHHFGEALNIFPEIGTSTEFCTVVEKKLLGYHSSCAAVCGRNTPVQKRTLYDQFIHSLSENPKFQNVLEILIEDNLLGEIPIYLRQNLQLDFQSFPEDHPQSLLFPIQTLNTIRCMLEGSIWDSSYIVALLQSGKQGAKYLIQILASKMPQYTPSQKDKIRSFLISLNVNEGITEIIVPQLMSYATLASLFTHEEIVGMWSYSEEKAVKITKSAFDVSLGTNYNDIGDLTWDIIHSYDPILLQNAIRHYMEVKPIRGDTRKPEVFELNVDWRLPIPVYNTLMKLPANYHRHVLYVFVVKAEEATAAKSYKAALDLLNEGCEILSNISNREPMRLFKMLSWLILVTKIQQCLDQLPCVEESIMDTLTTDAKKCLSSFNSTEGVTPWSNIISWCLLLLLNVQEWSAILNEFSLLKNISFSYMIKPLASTARSLQEKNTDKKIWYDLWDAVRSVVVVGNNYYEHKMSNQSSDGVNCMSRAGFMEFISNIKEASCLSIFISLLGHYLNISNGEPSNEIHIDHLAMWPSSVTTVKNATEPVKDTLEFLVNHATRLYPAPTHTSVDLCTSWHLTKADLAYFNEEYKNAMQNYLTAIFVATDYLRNDTTAEQIISGDLIIKRMIRCCMNLNCYTQAAILCQFLETLDYSTAVRCLQERNSVDAMDAYYECLWDVTLMEFIINMHQKRGEIQRRDKVLKIIGLLEVNSNNNEEIQREAAKARKNKFLRALAKQYL